MFLVHFSDFLSSLHTTLHIFVVLSLLMASYKTHFEKLSQKKKKTMICFFVFKRQNMCTILLRRRILDQSLPFKSDATLQYSARTLPVKKAYFFLISLGTFIKPHTQYRSWDTFPFFLFCFLQIKTHILEREFIKKNGYFMVRMTVRVDHPSPLRSAFRYFLCAFNPRL